MRCDNPHSSPRGPRTWIGRADGVAPTVIHLPNEYFTEDQRCLLGGGPRKKECGCVFSGVGCAVCENTLGVHKTLCPAHLSMVGTSSSRTSYTFLASMVSPPVPQRRKAPIVINRSELRMPSRDEQSNLQNWLYHYRRMARGPLPISTDLMDVGMQVDVRTDSEEAEMLAAQARKMMRLRLEKVSGVFEGDIGRLPKRSPV